MAYMECLEHDNFRTGREQVTQRSDLKTTAGVKHTWLQS